MQERVQVGHTYHHYTALEKTDRKQGSCFLWKVRCVCGKIRELKTADIGRKKSCGCDRRKPLPHVADALRGQQFGDLIAVAQTLERSEGSVVWICYCNCGEVVKVCARNLKHGITKSCGHRKMGGAKTKHIDGRSKVEGYRRGRCQKYRTNKLHRTPKWADEDAIQTMYARCPDKYTVDHIYPLQGALISGLHVLENLQYLTRSENCSKSNAFTPHILYPDGTIQYI